jgi:hypothetical protein
MKLEILLNGDSVFESNISPDDVFSLNINKETEKNYTSFTIESMEDFDKFRKAYPGKKRGNETEFNNFRKKHKDWRAVITLLLPAVENQIRDKQRRRYSGSFVPEWPNMQTWINQRRWEEEINAPAVRQPETIPGMSGFLKKV